MSKKFLQSDKQNLLNSIGTELSWGWSPAVDFSSLLDADCLYVDATPAITTGPSPAPTTTAPSGSKVQKTKSLEDDIFGSSSEDDENDNSGAGGGGGDGEEASINILLVGAGDIRHIFKTLAEVCVKNKELGAGAKKHRIPKINFYLYEPNLRVQARHLLFLQWLVDSVFSFDELEDRVAVFLEAYGNSMVREVTSEHIKLESKRVLRMMGFDEGKLAGRVNLEDELKSKERDFIEHQIRQWTRPSTDADARIEAIWLKRLRTEMADRFDNKDNLIDYDFTFGVLEQTHGLKFPEYRLWRNTGVAYDYCHVNPRKGVNYNYTEPNRTLCHFQRRFKDRVKDITPTANFSSSSDEEEGGTGDAPAPVAETAPIEPLRDNETRPTRGLSEQPTVGVYLGDIKAGPFFSFGIDSENPHLHHRNVEGQLKYGNGVMAMHNIRAWLYQLLTGGSKWPWADHKLAWDDPAAYNFLPPGAKKDNQHTAELPASTFTCVGLDLERLFVRRNVKAKEEAAKKKGASVGSKYKFDAAFVGSNSTQFMTPAFFDSLADHGVIVAETIKFVVDASDEAKTAFNGKIRDLCRNAGTVVPTSDATPSPSPKNGWFQDNTLTEQLHANVVPLKKREVAATVGQARADLRYASPYQLVFKKGRQ